jgi:ABC transporter substrate binding protein
MLAARRQGPIMRRRELILAMGGTVGSARAPRAQQNTIAAIGYLASATPAVNAKLLPAFHQGLSETGYVEGQSVAIEYRWAEDRYDRLPALAADLVSAKVDVIVSTGGITGALAAKNATSTKPIVFITGDDPVERGLVASLARPGGNLTGISFLTVGLTPKRLELLSELVPHVKLIALLVNPNNASAERVMRDVREAAAVKGLALRFLSRHRRRDRRRVKLPRSTAGWRAARRHRPVLRQPARPTRRVGGTLCRSGVLRTSGIHRCGRHDQLGAQFSRCLAGGGHLCGKNPKGCQAGRSFSSATHQIRAGRQSQNRQRTGLAIPPAILARADEVIE